MIAEAKALAEYYRRAEAEAAEPVSIQRLDYRHDEDSDISFSLHEEDSD